jgi:hypothetical protein
VRAPVEMKLLDSGDLINLARELPLQNRQDRYGGETKMNFMRMTAVILFASIVSLAPALKADQWDKKTVMTIGEPIQLPNVVLQPGTYVLKLLNSLSDRHIVQVFDKDDTHLITTILAIPNYRLQPTGKTQFRFWEAPVGQPRALRAWFYPGDNFGQEFAYPKGISTVLASTTKESVPTTTAETQEQYKTAEVTTTNEAGLSAALDQQTYARTEPTPAPVATPEPTPAPVPQSVQEPEPQPAAAPAPDPAPVEIPQELPHTATTTPLVGLIGITALVTLAATSRFKRTR